MKHIFICLAAAFTLVSGLSPAEAKSFREMFPEFHSQLMPEYQAMVDTLDFKTGTVTIGDNLATLDLGEKYYYLGVKDARLVLEDLWGNPGSADTMGLVFPLDKSPLDAEAWGLEITFDPIGYVSDKDAEGYDYGELLQQMRAELVEENKARVQEGYSTITLVGWAAQPRYDMATRMLYWAKELHFSS